MTEITITLDDKVIDGNDIHDITVKDLTRARMTMYGSPVEVGQRDGKYQFDWRGYNFNREFSADDPAHALVSAVRHLSSYVNPDTQHLTF